MRGAMYECRAAVAAPVACEECRDLNDHCDTSQIDTGWAGFDLQAARAFNVP